MQTNQKFADYLSDECTLLAFETYIYVHIQLPTFAFTRLLNKPYENEVTLAGQNLP